MAENGASVARTAASGIVKHTFDGAHSSPPQLFPNPSDVPTKEPALQISQRRALLAAHLGLSAHQLVPKLHEQAVRRFAQARHRRTWAACLKLPVSDAAKLVANQIRSSAPTQRPANQADRPFACAGNQRPVGDNPSVGGAHGASIASCGNGHNSARVAGDEVAAAALIKRDIVKRQSGVRSTAVADDATWAAYFMAVGQHADCTRKLLSLQHSGETNSKRKEQQREIDKLEKEQEEVLQMAESVTYSIGPLNVVAILCSSIDHDIPTRQPDLSVFSGNLSDLTVGGWSSRAVLMIHALVLLSDHYDGQHEAAVMYAEEFRGQATALTEALLMCHGLPAPSYSDMRPLARMIAILQECTLFASWSTMNAPKELLSLSTACKLLQVAQTAVSEWTLPGVMPKVCHCAGGSSPPTSAAAAAVTAAPLGDQNGKSDINKTCGKAEAELASSEWLKMLYKNRLLALHDVLVEVAQAHFGLLDVVMVQLEKVSRSGSKGLAPRFDIVYRAEAKAIVDDVRHQLFAAVRQAGMERRAHTKKQQQQQKKQQQQEDQAATKRKGARRPGCGISSETSAAAPLAKSEAAEVEGEITVKDAQREEAPLECDLTERSIEIYKRLPDVVFSGMVGAEATAGGGGGGGGGLVLAPWRPAAGLHAQLFLTDPWTLREALQRQLMAACVDGIATNLKTDGAAAVQLLAGATAAANTLLTAHRDLIRNAAAGRSGAGASRLAHSIPSMVALRGLPWSVRGTPAAHAAGPAPKGPAGGARRGEACEAANRAPVPGRFMFTLLPVDDSVYAQVAQALLQESSTQCYMPVGADGLYNIDLTRQLAQHGCAVLDCKGRAGLAHAVQAVVECHVAALRQGGQLLVVPLLAEQDHRHLAAEAATRMIDNYTQRSPDRTSLPPPPSAASPSSVSISQLVGIPHLGGDHSTNGGSARGIGGGGGIDSEEGVLDGGVMAKLGFGTESESEAAYDGEADQRRSTSGSGSWADTQQQQQQRLVAIKGPAGTCLVQDSDTESDDAAAALDAAVDAMLELTVTTALTALGDDCTIANVSGAQAAARPGRSTQSSNGSGTNGITDAPTEANSGTPHANGGDRGGASANGASGRMEERGDLGTAGSEEAAGGGDGPRRKPAVRNLMLGWQALWRVHFSFELSRLLALHADQAGLVARGYPLIGDDSSSSDQVASPTMIGVSYAVAEQCKRHDAMCFTNWGRLRLLILEVGPSAGTGGSGGGSVSGSRMGRGGS